MTQVKKRGVDMTEGSIARHLLLFAFPLLLGNLFQQFYNMVDTWVVGNFVSNEAFSAVGSVGPIINTLIGLFAGLSTGAGAVISQFYGAKRYDKVHNTVHTAILMTLILGVIFTAVGILLSPLMLELMKTPPEVMPESTAYLSIYFAGILGLMVYNIGAGILRAVGDSKRPFYYLVVSALLNVALDLLFVIGFEMGVKGVAYATVISQGVSAVLVMITLLCTRMSVRLSLRELRLHWDMLGKILAIGLPASLQMAVTAFSNIFVQSYINVFGPDHMSGWTAYSKIDQFMFLPMQSLSLAATTFVAQNLGARREARARRGVTLSVLMSMASCVLLMIPILFLSPYLVGFFNDKPEVMEIGGRLLRMMSPFYILCCLNQVLAASLRGAGNSRAPMIMMLSSFVVFRQIYLYIAANFLSNDFTLIAMSYPAGWLLASILMTLYYRRADLSASAVVGASAPAEEEAPAQEEAGV